MTHGSKRRGSVFSALAVFVLIVGAPYVQAKPRKANPVPLKNVKQQARAQSGGWENYCGIPNWEEVLYSGGCGNSATTGDHGHDCKGETWQVGTQDGHWLEIYGGHCYLMAASCWDSDVEYHYYFEKCNGNWVERSASQFGNCQCYE